LTFDPKKNKENERTTGWYYFINVTASDDSDKPASTILRVNLIAKPTLGEITVEDVYPGQRKAFLFEATNC
jgi:hypothetical protein